MVAIPFPRVGCFVGALVVFLLCGRLFADYPVLGHRYLADPSTMVANGRLYVYCSNDDDNPVAGGYLISSVVCLSTADMKNWTDHGEVLRVPRDVSWAKNTWAPAAVGRNGKYYLYFANGGGGNIGVVSGPSPVGPFTDVLGHPLVSGQTPGAAGKNMWLFDPAVFVDDDGAAFLFFGGNGDDNARVVRLAPDMVSLAGPAAPLHVPHFFEAAWVHKRGGVYYFSYSTNPATGMRIDYMTSASPGSGYRYQGIVAGQPPQNIGNNNHSSIVEFKGRWYHVYHSRAAALANGIRGEYRRSLGVEELAFDDKGGISQVRYEKDGLLQNGSLDALSQVEAETYHGCSGIATSALADGGMQLVAKSDRAWVLLKGVAFSRAATRFKARVVFPSMGCRIEVRESSPTGRLLASCSADKPDDCEGWRVVVASVEIPVSTSDLVLVFRGDADSLPRVDWWRFE